MRTLQRALLLWAKCKVHEEELGITDYCSPVHKSKVPRTVASVQPEPPTARRCRSRNAPAYKGTRKPLVRALFFLVTMYTTKHGDAVISYVRGPLENHVCNEKCAKDPNPFCNCGEDCKIHFVPDKDAAEYLVLNKYMPTQFAEKYLGWSS